MKQLAIKGHPTRGKEVIEILEMLGGKNKYSHKGVDEHYIYYINDIGNICRILEEHLSSDDILFTLEEFLKKYPYKVGDKVLIDKTYFRTVTKMQWYADTIHYTLKNNNGIEIIDGWEIWQLEPYTEEQNISDREFKDACEKAVKECLFGNNEEQEEINMENDLYISNPYNILKNNSITLTNPCVSKIIFDNCENDEVELDFGDKFQLEYKDKKYYAARKKPTYPKTYEECCNILNINKNDSVTHGYKNRLLDCFQKLIICRDAYCKIARDWKPNWEEIEADNYSIWVDSNEVVKGTIIITNTILAFPTEEMRDIFYENFKDLIEECKELL